MDGPERDIVSEWIDDQGDASDGFADAVIDAWRSEVEAEAEADDVVVPLAPRRNRRRLRNVVATVAGLAAAAAVLLLMARPSGNLDDRSEVSSASEVAVNDEAPAALEELRGELRTVLAAHCAPCHRGGADDANPMALDVFDVSAERWWTSVSTRQLGALQQRLSDEPGVTAGERALVTAYVTAELAHRG